jgi:predicted NBD/HSP70 family sugar kinase
MRPPALTARELRQPVTAPASAGDVLDLVRTGRAATRSDVARLTGLSRTAVNARVSALVDTGLLTLGGELASTGGRPPGSLVFNHEAGVVLAVAIGRSRSQLAVFDLNGDEVASDSRDHPVGISAQRLMPDVAERLGGLLGPEAPSVLAIGMSLSGLIDPVRHVSIDSPVMRGWDGIELEPFFADVARVPLFLANDAIALARSELFGRAAHPEDALVVKASTGLGLGVISDGRVLTGHVGSTGEIGHCRSAAAEGVPCRCGAVGCLEAVAGGWALVHRYAESGGSATHVRDLVQLALEGDTVARRLLRESGRALGELLAVAVNLLNPKSIVIGGDMAAAFDIYVGGLRESLYAGTTSRNARDLEFRPSRHGEKSGLVGCAALAIEGVLSPDSVEARLG